MKLRIDQLMVQQGLAPSRERAQRLIMAGLVLVGDHRVKKASETFPDDVANITVSGQDHPYVGRGGQKLEAALKHFNICVKNFVCADIGASTGGFSDCLLQHDAAKIYAIDVGTNQLAWKLRQDPRVVCHEQLHAMEITPKLFAEPISLVVMDVSFISVTKLIPHLLNTLPGHWDLIVLIKPQFEAGRDQVQKGGIIKDESLRQQICERISQFINDDSRLSVQGIIPSPILGDKGNQEFLLYAKRA